MRVNMSRGVTIRGTAAATRFHGMKQMQPNECNLILGATLPPRRPHKLMYRQGDRHTAGAPRSPNMRPGDDQARHIAGSSPRDAVCDITPRESAATEH